MVQNGKMRSNTTKFSTLCNWGSGSARTNLTAFSKSLFTGGWCFLDTLACTVVFCNCHRITHLCSCSWKLRTYFYGCKTPFIIHPTGKIGTLLMWWRTGLYTLDSIPDRRVHQKTPNPHKTTSILSEIYVQLNFSIYTTPCNLQPFSRYFAVSTGNRFATDN